MRIRWLILPVILGLLWGNAPICAAQEPVLPDGIAAVGYDQNKDYFSLMKQCAQQGTPQAIMLGAIYEKQRNLKIETGGYSYPATEFFTCFDGNQITAQLVEYENPPPEPEPEAVHAVYYYTEQEVAIVAKILYLEARGITSATEKACVAWTICNRVDAGKYGNSVTAVALAPNQFAYSKRAPVTDELYGIAKDVLERWNREKNGASDVGRVLPKGYLWYTGDGRNNWFRNSFRGGNVWRYSLPSPYHN